MIRVAQWTCLLALGALVVAIAFFAAPLAPWMMLSCSTAALALSITSHFHSVHFVEPLFNVTGVKTDSGMTAEELYDFDKRRFKLSKAADRRLKDTMLDSTTHLIFLPNSR